jgi:hypothetical protein
VVDEEDTVAIPIITTAMTPANVKLASMTELRFIIAFTPFWFVTIRWHWWIQVFTYQSVRISETLSLLDPCAAMPICRCSAEADSSCDVLAATRCCGLSEQRGPSSPDAQSYESTEYQTCSND